MARRLVAPGLWANLGLLVDAMDRAYNASVCRLEVPTFEATGPRRRAA
jgi:hypothetical protein